LLAALTQLGFGQSPWKFIVTCDSRGSSGGINSVILSELAAEIVSQNVDFILFPGDLVNGIGCTPSQFEGQLRNWLETMKPVYDANIAVYVCRGNHELGDVWSHYPDPGTEPDPNDNFSHRWLNVFGSDSEPNQKMPDNGPAGEEYMTYSVIHKNAFIVSLDQYAGTRHDFAHKVNQTWLDAQLAENTKAHIFITGHEPAFRAHHNDCLDYFPANRDLFWASLRNARARVYLTGHDHFYDHARVDEGDGDPNNDIHQYIIGTAGAPLYTWSPPYDGNNSYYTVEQVHYAKRYGYVVVEVNDLEVTLTWTERHTNDLGVAGMYQAQEVWNYTTVPRPIVLSPNGSEQIAATSTYNITWKTLEGAEIDNIKIEYSTDNGQNWDDVNTVPNSGSYKWSPVPEADSNQCLVRISDLIDPNIGDVSDDVFTIYQCRQQLDGDFNNDCYIDLLDIAIIAQWWLQDFDFSDFAVPSQNWLKCGNPLDPSCDVLQ